MLIINNSSLFLYLMPCWIKIFISCPASAPDSSSISVRILFFSKIRLIGILPYLILMVVSVFILKIPMLLSMLNCWQLGFLFHIHQFECCFNIFIIGKLVKESLFGLLISKVLIGWRYRDRVKLGQVSNIQFTQKDQLCVRVKLHPVCCQDFMIFFGRSNWFKIKIINVCTKKLFSTFKSLKLKQAMWTINSSYFGRVPHKFIL
jgi:hypothetical protein